ncbi:MAG: alpha-amylase [Arthrobacter sp.]|nr:alpha-amylase [Arthrobacter sp.]
MTNQSPILDLVGEVNLESARAARYTRADEMQQAFAFAFVKLGWNPAAWAAIGNDLETARQLHGATPTWALENHDIVRTVTRFGGVCRDGARVPLPWTGDAALNHGFSLSQRTSRGFRRPPAGARTRSSGSSRTRGRRCGW